MKISDNVHKNFFETNERMQRSQNMVIQYELFEKNSTQEQNNTNQSTMGQMLYMAIYIYIYFYIKFILTID